MPDHHRERAGDAGYAVGQAERGQGGGIPVIGAA
jgi:hypothetical protein